MTQALPLLSCFKKVLRMWCPVAVPLIASRWCRDLAQRRRLSALRVTREHRVEEPSEAAALGEIWGESAPSSVGNGCVGSHMY